MKSWGAHVSKIPSKENPLNSSGRDPFFTLLRLGKVSLQVLRPIQLPEAFALIIAAFSVIKHGAVDIFAS